MQASIPFGRRRSSPEMVATELPAPAPPRRRLTLTFFERVSQESLDRLAAHLTAKALEDVEDVLLTIASPGGELLPMLELHRMLLDLPVKLHTHAAGMVASAATHLFLAGAERSADPSAGFLFHQVSNRAVAPPGSFIERSMERHRQLFQLTAHELYRTRTQLPPELVERFAHEEIVLDAQQALQYGVIHRICDLTPAAGADAALAPPAACVA